MKHAHPHDSTGQMPEQDKNVILRIVLGFLLLMLAFYAMRSGYHLGADLAHKHNYQDCVAEGRSGCNTG